MPLAREAFERTEYKALSAPRREQYDIRMGYVEFTQEDYAAAYDRFSRIGSRSEYADHALYYRPISTMPRGVTTGPSRVSRS